MADVLDKVITLGSVVGGEDGGKRGRDGFSPITKLEDLGESVRFTVTDATHSDSVEIAKGKNGDKGEKGDKGDKGDKGEKGDKGDKGEKGTQLTVEQSTDSLTIKTSDGSTAVIPFPSYVAELIIS